MFFELNGEKKLFGGNLKISLLEYLKTIEGICITKEGCSGKGLCGACTVQLDDKPVLACLTPMESVREKSIDTNDRREQMIQDVFSVSLQKMGTAECSYCVPEVVMKARTLLKNNLAPTHQEVLKVVGMHLCRCIGREKIAQSVLHASVALENMKIGCY